MQFSLYFVDKYQQDSSFIIALLFMISTIVIADPNSELNLPDNFNHLTVDEVFSEDNWREPEEEIEWREPVRNSSRPSREVRWGAQTPYEDNNELDPIVSPSENRPSGVVKTPEVTPQFQIRF